MQLNPVVEGIFQVQIPLPFLLNIVNCYLLRDADGWTVVDTGLNRPEGQAVWRAAFAALDMRPRDLRRIIVTHHHPDHYGMAGWLQGECVEDGGERPPVLMSAREAESADVVWKHRPEGYPGMVEQLTQCGAPEELIAAVVGGIEDTRLMTFPQVDTVSTIEAGQSMLIGERAFHLLHAPGHSDGQLLLYDAADRILLSGDHVLMKITPNIGQWTHTDPQPLQRFLLSLNELRSLEVRLALPGHKTLITDWGGRIDELLAHHAVRLDAMTAAVAGGAETVYAVARAIFDFSRLTTHEHRFALAETLAHLDYLVDAGRVRRDESGGVWLHHTP